MRRTPGEPARQLRVAVPGALCITVHPALWGSGARPTSTLSQTRRTSSPREGTRPLRHHGLTMQATESGRPEVAVRGQPVSPRRPPRSPKHCPVPQAASAPSSIPRHSQGPLPGFPPADESDSHERGPRHPSQARTALLAHSSGREPAARPGPHGALRRRADTSRRKHVTGTQDRQQVWHSTPAFPDASICALKKPHIEILIFL